MKKTNQNRGFTLVEILVVVALIGTLAAVAVPQFAAYREKSYCNSVKNDLANLARHEESYYYDHETYLAASSNPDNTSNVPNHRWSNGVTVISSTGDVNSWKVVAVHPNCSQGSFTYDSNAGGLQ